MEKEKLVKVRHGLEILCAAVLVTCCACNNVLENTNIPSARVYFEIDVSISGTDNQLRDGLTGNSKFYNDKNPAVQSYGYGAYGYSGVVVVRAYDNELYAFDTCCPYETDRDIAVEDDGYFVTCPKCGSSFEIGNGYGYVSKGPATQPLKQYKVYSIGADKYIVRNY